MVTGSYPVPHVARTIAGIYREILASSGPESSLAPALAGVGEP